MLQLIPPIANGKVLLHVCCAPCSLAIVECLKANNIDFSLFFCNPNIFPQYEYMLRKEEVIRFAHSQGIVCIDGDESEEYNNCHQWWLDGIAGLEMAPERGVRCEKCFQLRLLKAFKYASENGFEMVSTTLATSRWKSLQQVTSAGKWCAQQVPNVCFWIENWRKGGLQQRRSELLKLSDYYNQNYCGCEFSKRVAEEKKSENSSNNSY